jgi:hypothetical protein
VPRIDKPVDPRIIDELSKKFADFRRAYTEDGLSAKTFDSFGPTRRTLRQFIAGYGDLGAIIRDFIAAGMVALLKLKEPQNASPRLLSVKKEGKEGRDKRGARFLS